MCKTDVNVNADLFSVLSDETKNILSCNHKTRSCRGADNEATSSG